MNKINPVKINGVIKEIGSKKETVKEVVSQAKQEVETKASNIGRDLVNSVEQTPNITISELLKKGYSMGEANIIFKMDHKSGLYKAVQFKNGEVSNITIEDTLSKQKAVISEKLKNGKWISINNRGESYNMIDGNTSDRAIKKATELQFDGYKITAQDEKSLTFCKNDSCINISKSNGKEIK